GIAEEGEPGHLDALGGRNERLGDEQVGEGGEGQSFRAGKQKAAAIVEGIAREGSEPGVPHEGGEEGGVDRHRGASLVSGAFAVGSGEAVVVDADGDGLSVPEAVCGGVTAATGVVVIQSRNGVEPEEASEVGELWVKLASEAGLEGLFDP